MDKSFSGKSSMQKVKQKKIVPKTKFDVETPREGWITKELQVNVFTLLSSDAAMNNSKMYSMLHDCKARSNGLSDRYPWEFEQKLCDPC